MLLLLFNWQLAREVFQNQKVNKHFKGISTDIGFVTYCYVADLLYPSYPLLLPSDVPPTSSRFDNDVSCFWICCMVESPTSSTPRRFWLRRRTVISRNYAWLPLTKRTWWAVIQRLMQDATSLQVSRACSVFRFIFQADYTVYSRYLLEGG